MLPQRCNNVVEKWLILATDDEVEQIPLWWYICNDIFPHPVKTGIPIWKWTKKLS